jgi:hypothetical protein
MQESLGCRALHYPGGMMKKYLQWLAGLRCVEGNPRLIKGANLATSLGQI